MKSQLDKLIRSLDLISNRFDEKSKQQKNLVLRQISKIKLPLKNSLFVYSELLLFLCAHPDDKKTLSLVEQELKRITATLKKTKKVSKDSFNNSGLPYTETETGFSYDFVRWLLTHPNCKAELSRFENPSFELNEVLRLTLPSLEKSETTAGLSNMELLDSLLLKKQSRLSFLVSELSKIDHLPFVKDHLFEGLGSYITITPKDNYFSKFYNRLLPRSVFFHDELLKRFDFESLLNSEFSEKPTLSKSELNKAILIVKNSMAITERETDTVTFMDESSFRLFELERGISVAIYGMKPERQLPLESYVGFTLFKNGFPAAYGGSWIFGERSNFGINIFESYRGGESGYMMCQLLRVYRQVFKINYFEIEPYQFGLDNPEGISSGAFWFYYRFGFRPLDKKLLLIAEKESKKIRLKKDYRTSKKVLEQFTESNIILKMERSTPPGLYDIIAKVKHMMQRQYAGNRVKAENDCVMRFKIKTRWAKILNRHEEQVMKEVALWAEAMRINDLEKLDILSQMIKTKPIDLYQYQNLLLKFFKNK